MMTGEPTLENGGLGSGLPQPKMAGMQVKVCFRNEECARLMTTPEQLRFIVGAALDSHGLNEEIDYTLEVTRFYE